MGFLEYKASELGSRLGFSGSDAEIDDFSEFTSVTLLLASGFNASFLREFSDLQTSLDFLILAATALGRKGLEILADFDVVCVFKTRGFFRSCIYSLFI